MIDNVNYKLQAPATNEEVINKVSLFTKMIDAVNLIYQNANIKIIDLNNPGWDPRKDAIAFLMEKQLQQPYGKGLVETFIKQEINPNKNENKLELAVSISSRIQKLVKEHYFEFLNSLQSTNTSNDEQAQIALRFTYYEMVDSMIQGYYSKNEYFNFGGIPEKYLPKWYLDSFKQSS